MNDFEIIEKEYLAIEPLNKNKLFAFYKSHKHYFENDTPKASEQLKKYLWMLSEIGVSYSYSGDHKTALKILDKVIKYYELKQGELSINLNEEKEYNSAIWSKGYSHFDLKQYSKAKQFLKRINEIDNLESKDKNELLLKICNWKIYNRIAVGLGTIGLLVIIVNYSIKWFSSDNYTEMNIYFGFLGGLLLISSGILYKTKIKEPIANNS